MTAVADGIRCTISYSHLADTAEVAQNVLHFKKSAAASFADAVDAIDSKIMQNSLGGFAFAWALVGSAQASLGTRRYFDLSSDPVVSIIDKSTGTQAGGSLGALPFQMAIAASLRTTNASRRGRGRVFLPYLGAAILQADTGKITDATAQALADRMEEFRNQVDDDIDVDSFVVYSRMDNVLRPVSEVRVGEQVDTIRRRRNKRGEAYNTGV